MARMLVVTCTCMTVGGDRSLVPIDDTFLSVDIQLA